MPSPESPLRWILVLAASALSACASTEPRAVIAPADIAPSARSAEWRNWTREPYGGLVGMVADDVRRVPVTALEIDYLIGDPSATLRAIGYAALARSGHPDARLADGVCDATGFTDRACTGDFCVWTSTSVGAYVLEALEHPSSEWGTNEAAVAAALDEDELAVLMLETFARDECVSARPRASQLVRRWLSRRGEEPFASAWNATLPETDPALRMKALGRYLRTTWTEVPDAELTTIRDALESPNEAPATRLAAASVLVHVGTVDDLAWLRESSVVIDALAGGAVTRAMVSDFDARLRFDELMRPLSTTAPSRSNRLGERAVSAAEIAVPACASRLDRMEDLFGRGDEAVHRAIRAARVRITERAQAGFAVWDMDTDVPHRARFWAH